MTHVSNSSVIYNKVSGSILLSDLKSKTGDESKYLKTSEGRGFIQGFSVSYTTGY
jgi:hypothetical protein